MPSIAIILPPNEMFTLGGAGAIAMVVRRLAAATPDATVIGAPQTGTFPGIAFQSAAGIFGIIKMLGRMRPAFIEVHQQPRLAVILSLLFRRARVMLFIHNDPLTMRGLKSKTGRRFARARLHRIICVSDYLKTRFMTGLTGLTGLAGSGPDVLPNPLSLDELPPPATSRTKTILFAGRMVADKGPDIFIQACAAALPLLPGWTARMLGGDRFGPDSPQTAYMRQIAEAAEAAGMEFAGARPHAEVLAAMGQAAIVVVPSRWAEPFGLTALEAMASGAALIASACGGLPEVAGDAAFYVPPADPKALEAALLSLARDPETLSGLAAKGLARAQKFDTKLIAARLEILRAALPAQDSLL